MVNIIFGFFIGTILGSLIDCIASRAVREKSFWGRSYCLKCKKTLKWYDLFPLVSYIVLKGRCRYCHGKIPLETFIIEVISGFVTALIFYKGLSPNYFVNLSISSIQNIFPLVDTIEKIYIYCILFIVVITDLKEGVIPNRIMYPAIFTILIYTLFFDVLKIGFLYSSLNSTEFGRLLLPPHSDFFQRHAMIILDPLIQSFIAGVSIALFFGGVIFFTKGRGMGGGDLTLGVFIGLSLGFPNAFLALLLSFVLGSVAGTALVIGRKKSFKQTIPFGPFLSLGSLIGLLWGNELIGWYLSLRSF